MLKIQEIIPLTIQGEGFHSGMPCSFIRLFGCPVGCHFCDTGYALGEKPPKFTLFLLEEILDHIKSDNIVITGGEPCINTEFTKLVVELKNKEKNISVETSGIKNLPILSDVWVTLSPKEHISNNGRVDQEVFRNINELKLIVSNPQDIKYYENRIYWCNSKNIPVFFQPEWNVRHDILEVIIELADRYNAKVSNQIHKLIGVQ
ncbi:MAG: 7-carboxy-7-deazaguanine synthase QueE [Dolichospermum sp.]